MYDLVSVGKKGVNWAANLEDYNRILNEECKEELGWRSPPRNILRAEVKSISEGVAGLCRFR